MYMEQGPEQIGKFLLIIGVVISIIGLLMIFLPKTGLFKLPGDFRFGTENFKVYFPLATSIIISLILTLIFWLIHYFRN